MWALLRAALCLSGGRVLSSVSSHNRKENLHSLGSLYEGLNPTLQALQLHITVLGD